MTSEMASCFNVHEPIIQKIVVPEVPQIGIIDDECRDDGEEIVVGMQITRVVNDEEFDVTVQNELKVVKQLWADMAARNHLRHLFRGVRKKKEINKIFGNPKTRIALKKFYFHKSAVVLVAEPMN
ncbi:hypothetical protein A2U01_0029871 [Trifolium medium]|uniref:Uncharacterized protein n=1 Tax=Trifolium medium TaxID=97028 RepID=A0A392PBG1_9FABA|nr:hypothetical protein [Trifolium medium]